MRWKASLLPFILGAIALSQTPQVESEAVDRVGSHIACQCGGCKESVSCPMSKRGCSFCAPAKARIYKMQKAGMSDETIIADYRKQYGDQIYLSDPSAFYWIVPAFVLALGLGAIYLFVRRYAKPRALAPAGGVPVDDPSLHRYREQVERETADIE